MLINFYKWAENFKNNPARRNRYIIATNGLAIIINILLWILLYYEFHRFASDNPDISNLPLHYNVFFGIDKFGPWYAILWLPGTGLIIAIINLLLAFITYNKKILASYFLSFSNLLAQILLALSAILIILINL